MSTGTAWVIETLGATLAALQQQVAEQQAEIARLQAELAKRPAAEGTSP